MSDSITAAADEVKSAVMSVAEGVSLDYTIKERADGPFLLFELAQPNNRFFRMIEAALVNIPKENQFRERTTVVRRPRTPGDRLSLPETQLLRAAISESLTVDKNSFEEDFFSRYTASVTNFENQIITNANFIVYGRRGAGKSSLLSYAMHKLKQRSLPFAWVAMQVYAGRSELKLVADIIEDIVSQLREFPHDESTYLIALSQIRILEKASDADFPRILRQTLPKLQHFVRSVSSANRNVTIFLDDFHVLPDVIQPQVLAALYGIARGQRTHIKISGIEQFSRPWDAETSSGLQPNQDAQIIRLDHNLTMPDRSRKHIIGILDAQARFCGLPNIRFLTSEEALSRLVWVAAAVPRDALSLFSLAISKGIAKGEKRVSVTSINAAASESAEAKLKDVDQDASSQKELVLSALDAVGNFCIQRNRRNAFLLEIDNSDPVYKAIQKLISLRFVHVLHEGITPHRAGKRFVALMLDYGFYVGVRAAKSVGLFQKEPRTILAKDLRKLPVFPLTTPLPPETAMI